MNNSEFYSNVVPQDVGEEISSLINTAINLAWSNLVCSMQQSQDCLIPDFGFHGKYPDYGIPMNRHLYMLKYFPAYLYEYTKMYQEIFRRAVKRGIANLSVLSFGCGCGLDFYGLYFARKICDTADIAISYKGIDLVDWDYRDLVSIQNNFQPTFSNYDVAKITNNYLEGYNVLVFPKSLSDFSDESFKSLCDNVHRSRFTLPLFLAASTADGATDRQRARCERCR